jgi:hypothetical protein
LRRLDDRFDIEFVLRGSRLLHCLLGKENLLILPIYHNNRTAIAFDFSRTLFQRLSSAIFSIVTSSNYIHLCYMKSTDCRHFIKRIACIAHCRCHFNTDTSTTSIMRSNGTRFNGIRCCLFLLRRCMVLLLNISDSISNIIIFVRLHHNHPLIMMMFDDLLGRRHVRVVVHHLELANNVLRCRLRWSNIRMLIFMKLHINHL